MSVEYSGTFVSLEGPEGAGKTTQLKLLTSFLKDEKIEYVITRDPGGTALGKPIRRILLSTETVINPTAELLLYEADRAQNVSEVILPALQTGKLVLCDRYIDSTLAYQGYGRKIDMELINTLNHIATGGLTPEMTILFDIDSSSGLARLHPGGHDRLEREAIEFHQSVRSGYLELARQHPERFRVIDASAAMSKVQEDLRRLVVEAVKNHVATAGK